MDPDWTRTTLFDFFDDDGGRMGTIAKRGLCVSLRYYTRRRNVTPRPLL